MLYQLCDLFKLNNHDDCCLKVDNGTGCWINEFDTETGVVYNYYIGQEEEWRHGLLAEDLVNE